MFHKVELFLQRVLSLVSDVLDVHLLRSTLDAEDSFEEWGKYKIFLVQVRSNPQEKVRFD